MKYWKKWRRRIVSIIVLLGLICLVMLVFRIHEVSTLEAALSDEKGALENISYIFQIIVGLLVVYEVFIAVWQYSLTSKAERNKIERDRINKAIENAGYYKDRILPEAKKVKKIYTKENIFDIFEKIDFQKMVNFDIFEMEQIISKEDIASLKKFGVGTSMFNKSIVPELYDENQSKTDEEKDEEKKDQEDKLSSLVVKLLNNLEVFSMYFVHEVADHTVVYQSLHMTYLEIVRMLYYDIAVANKTGEKKYYTNVILLFNKWRDIAESQMKEEIALVRRLNPGKILDDNKDLT